MRLELRMFDPNDPSHLNHVHVEAHEVIRTDRGPLELGRFLGHGSGGKVFEIEDNRAAKVVRRYRLEVRIARMIQEEPCENVIPILEVRKAADYAVIVMPKGESLTNAEYESLDLDRLYAPIDAYLAIRRLLYKDGRVPRNLIKLDGRVAVIDFSHARYIRRPRRRLREFIPITRFMTSTGPARHRTSDALGSDDTRDGHGTIGA